HELIDQWLVIFRLGGQAVDGDFDGLTALTQPDLAGPDPARGQGRHIGGTSPTSVAERIVTGGGNCSSASAGDIWMRRATSSPSTRLPKAAKPCPSGLRPPPWSRLGVSRTTTKKLEVALSGPSRAMETTPAMWLSPVSRV